MYIPFLFPAVKAKHAVSPDVWDYVGKPTVISSRSTLVAAHPLLHNKMGHMNLCVSMNIFPV